MPQPREFSIIERWLRPLAGPAARGLADDAAVLALPPGRELVVTADAMNEGVHYLAGTDPALLARKLLRVNLSDLAAMGAAPLGYMLTWALPHGTPDAWFEAFAAGLRQDQEAYGVRLLGGDSTATEGPATLSLTMLGTVVAGGAIGRDGAAAGDLIYVSGTPGDAVLGLAALQGRLADPGGYLAGRYHLPTPRLGLADGIASAAIDISDGLFSELGHVCTASGVSAQVMAALIPLSAAAQAAGPSWREQAMAGGDDYELLLAVPPAREAALLARGAALGMALHCVGRFAPPPICLLLDGVERAATGWSHF